MRRLAELGRCLPEQQSDGVFEFRTFPLERMMRDMDIVSRDEFEAVKAMAIAARDDNEKLMARIAELESKLNRS